MADLSLNVALVLPVTAGATYKDITAGATITAGQAVYRDSTDSDKAKLADANVSAAVADVYGIALHAALAGQPLRVQIGGNITIGATTANSVIYVLSATAGGITSDAIASGSYGTIIGIGVSATVIKLIIITSGVALA